MKFAAILVLTILSFTISYSQDYQNVLKTSVVKEKPFKKIKGVTWVEPLSTKFINTKKLDDTLRLEVPSIARFYPEVNQLNQSPNDGSRLDVFKYGTSPTTANLSEVLKPFYIKNFEVTNGEYKEFLNEQSSANRLRLQPDTTVWISDFMFSYNDPMTRRYFYQKRYDNYPVVGVTYHQAIAYCKWYQEKLNKELKLEGKRVIVDLPNQFEWAFANGNHYYAFNDSKVYLNNSFFDEDYLTNLNLKGDTTHHNLVNRAILPAYANMNSHNFMNDGYLYTTSIDQLKNVKSPIVVHKDQVNGVFYLNTNVSEWCKETYQDNWKELFEWRQKELRKLGTKEAVLTADLESYFNSFNDTTSGQLVRGGNWLYEHHAFRNGQNVGMHNAKLFINPNESHSTLGFRYVIRVVETSEELSTSK